ncbi:MAG: hypothetical protein A3G24_14040 [Betaproteobacteria bacterium RIFCSPLOWO2_12_FULL_62_13]|nr:MAG: hypothetical protein A3G24_14040 [Betaproteobacteria bacterium RIFCSPLOWO2_12_FULL_62_13]
MDTTTRQLIDYATGVEFSRLPSEVVHECKRRLIDTFACALGAYNEPLSYGASGREVACVLGAEKLLRLSRDQMGNAVSLALAPNMALVHARRGELSGWKGCAAANASRNAVFAALLAQDGFTGPPAVFEGSSGL